MNDLLRTQDGKTAQGWVPGDGGVREVTVTVEPGDKGPVRRQPTGVRGRQVHWGGR